MLESHGLVVPVVALHAVGDVPEQAGRPGGDPDRRPAHQRYAAHEVRCGTIMTGRFTTEEWGNKARCGLVEQQWAGCLQRSATLQLHLPEYSTLLANPPLSLARPSISAHRRVEAVRRKLGVSACANQRPRHQLGELFFHSCHSAGEDG